MIFFLNVFSIAVRICDRISRWILFRIGTLFKLRQRRSIDVLEKTLMIQVVSVNSSIWDDIHTSWFVYEKWSISDWISMSRGRNRRRLRWSPSHAETTEDMDTIIDITTMMKADETIDNTNLYLLIRVSSLCSRISSRKKKKRLSEISWNDYTRISSIVSFYDIGVTCIRSRQTVVT